MFHFFWGSSEKSQIGSGNNNGGDNGHTAKRQMLSNMNMTPLQFSQFVSCADKRVLYWYQSQHAREMLLNASKTEGRHGMILADEMGCGKTMQSLSVAAGLEELYEDQGPAVFVIPKCVLDAKQWQKEAGFFSRWIDQEIYVHHGPSRNQKYEEAKKELEYINDVLSNFAMEQVVNELMERNGTPLTLTFQMIDDIVSSRVHSTNQERKSRLCQSLYEKTRDRGVSKSTLKSVVLDHKDLFNPNRRLRLIFTTSGTVCSDGHNFLKGLEIGSLFYDEAHGIRNGVKGNQLNSSHKTSKALFDLSDRVRRCGGRRNPVFALTATPIFNDYEDLVSLFKFIGQEPECNPGYFQEESTRMQRLEEAKKKYVLRRLAKDVLTLPDNDKCTHFFHFSKPEVECAEKLQETLQFLSKQCNKNINGKTKTDGEGEGGTENSNNIQMKMRAQLLKMRQQCISKELVDHGDYIDELYKKAYETPGSSLTKEECDYLLCAMESSTKLFHFVQDIYKRSNGVAIHPTDDTFKKTGGSGEVVIATSEWVRALKLIGLIIHCPEVKNKYLPAGYQAPRLFMYHGGMNPKEKQRVLKECEANADLGIATVLLLSFHSGNVGLNLVFSRCVMCLEGWWNEALMKQMGARVHRNGQKHKCDVHQYVIEGTIEKHVLWLQASKDAVAMGVYGNEKEKLYATEQEERRRLSKQMGKKGFDVKEAVKHLKKIREDYLSETENKSLLDRGFRSKIEVQQQDKEIKKHTLKGLPVKKPSSCKPVRPRLEVDTKKNSSKKRGRHEYESDITSNENHSTKKASHSSNANANANTNAKANTNASSSTLDLIKTLGLSSIASLF